MESRSSLLDRDSKLSNSIKQHRATIVALCFISEEQDQMISSSLSLASGTTPFTQPRLS
jgi:hypothetical protein